MIIIIFTLIWVNSWPQATSTFRLTPMAPNLVLVTILNGRVHRNTKLGLYNKVQSNDPKSQPHTTPAYNMLPGNSYPSSAPVSMAITSVDGNRSEYSTRKSRASLDFGMV